MNLRDLATSILYSALAEPIGLAIWVSNRTRAKMRLYAARKAVSDPALDDLQIRESPFLDYDLIIVHRRVRDVDNDIGEI